MIIKKLKRQIKCRDWDKKIEHYRTFIIRDYVGWYLFGFIPLYKKQLTDCRHYKSKDDEDEILFEMPIYEKWKDKI